MATAIRVMVKSRPFLRPKRSAYVPMTAAPMGRMMKPTAKMASVDSRAATSLPAGKKWWAKIDENVE